MGLFGKKAEEDTEDADNVPVADGQVVEVTEKGTIVSDEEAVGKPLDVEEFWKLHEQKPHEEDVYFYNLGARRIEEVKQKFEEYKRAE